MLLFKSSVCRPAARFIVLNIVGAALFAASVMEGIGLIPFRADRTYMTHGIAVLFVVGLVCAAVGWWKAVEWIGGSLVLLGLIGTVVGFIIAFSGVDPAIAGEVTAITPMVAALVAGMGTAMHTTLVGAVGYLWLDLNRALFGPSDAPGN
mgnify:CR=1 FL=1